MNTRLQMFLDAENISQSQLADTIGVARASVSHILSGRNKPGFDFIENMSKHFPTLNLEWLVTGTGKMYKSASDTVIAARQAPVGETHSPSYDLFAPSDSEENRLEAPRISVPEPVAETPEPEKMPEPAVETPVQKPAKKQEIKEQIIEKKPDNQNYINNSFKQNRSISKIIVFYDDNTYQELK